MTVYLQDADFTLHVGDVRDVLGTLEDGSVDCVVTSPPYWGLRDYGTGSWAGGDPDCDHKNTNWDRSLLNDGANRDRTTPMRDVCGRCGATRTDQQLGLEPTPDLYVHNMVEVFRGVWRVLADHGTCWLNLGDSYASQGGPEPAQTKWQVDGASNTQNAGRSRTPGGLKPKDLVGIPWRVAFALQADGWYLRSDIVWAKPNPMPESVTDRPTKAHEYVFLLSKRPRYWFDQEAVRDPAPFNTNRHMASNRYDRTKGIDNGVKPAGTFGIGEPKLSRNVRSVWEIATQPYAEAHFATYPEELVRRCLLAGCPEWVCGSCGSPWVRDIEYGESDYARLQREDGHGWRDMDAAGLDRGVITREGEGGQTRRANGTVPSLRAASRTDRGFIPSCSCVPPGVSADVSEMLDDDLDEEHAHRSLSLLRSHLARPGVVLDPFLGSGTTALVARKHGRRCVGIELNPEYAALAGRRLQQLSLLA